MFFRRCYTLAELYDRQMRIEGLSQERISKAQLGIIGAGATGSHVAIYAAKVGFGEIRICDNDTVEPLNTPRLLGIGQEDVGRNKAEALAKAVKRIGTARVQAYPSEFSRLPDNFFAGLDAVVLCVDRISTRFEIGEALWRRSIPHVDIGIREFLLNIIVVIPSKETPCLYCSRRIIPKNQLAFSNTARHCTDAPIPTIITTAAIASSLAVTEVLKIITSEIGESLKGFLQMDIRNHIYHRITVDKDQNCPICG